MDTQVTKGILYYTNNKLDDKIFKAVQKQLLTIGLPIVSVSLKPIDFGQNIVMDLPTGLVTLTKQILKGLKTITTDLVFFAECDVLYNQSHFKIEPGRKDTFYYNNNILRWDYPKDRFVSFKAQVALLGMCAYRTLLLSHYTQKLKYITDKGFDNRDGDSGWMRYIGHEPGKSVKAGGLSNDPRITWQSEYPLIDIRHDQTLTRRLVDKSEFKRTPIHWKEITKKEIKGYEGNPLLHG